MLIRELSVIYTISCWALYLLLVTSAYAYEFPPYEGLTLKIDGNIAESYSNNISYTSDEDSRIEDLMTTLTLGVGIKYEGSRQTIGLSGNLNRQMPTKSGDIVNSSERVTVNYQNDLSKYDRITLINTYTHTQVPGNLDEGLDANECAELEELLGRSLLIQLYPECDEFEDEFGRLTGKFDSYNNTLSFNYKGDFSDQFNISTGYSYRENWSPEEGTTDSHGHTLRLGANYKYGITVYSLSYSFAENGYEGRGDISSQSIKAGMRYHITKLLYCTGKVGMNFTSSDNDNSNKNTTIEASLTQHVDEKTRATIFYSRGIELSSDREELFRNWRVSGSLSRQLWEDLKSSLSGFYGQGEFVSIDVTDTFVGASFSLAYNLWTTKRGINIKGNTGYTYSDLDSTDENRSYSRSGVNLGLTIGF